MNLYVEEINAYTNIYLFVFESFIFEIDQSMEGMRKIMINFYENSPVLKTYRKLSQIYDSSRWSPRYHLEVHMNVVDWLYYIVIVHLALNKDLPLYVRYMKKSEFRRQIKKWLQIANEHKEKRKLGKMYPFFSSLKFNFEFYFHGTSYWNHAWSTTSKCIPWSCGGSCSGFVYGPYLKLCWNVGRTSRPFEYETPIVNFHTWLYWFDVWDLMRTFPFANFLSSRVTKTSITWNNSSEKLGNCTFKWNESWFFPRAQIF